MSAPVVDVLPPRTLLRLLNPTLRWALRTPLGRGATGLALLQFTGRRSGRHYRVPVTWRELDGMFRLQGPIVDIGADELTTLPAVQISPSSMNQFVVCWPLWANGWVMEMTTAQ